MGILACCFYCCRTICPNGPKSIFKDLDMDDDVVWSNVHDVKLEVDQRTGLLGVSQMQVAYHSILIYQTFRIKLTQL